MSEQQLLEETLTVREAAKMADVHFMTIYRWIYEGILPVRKTRTGRYRIRPDDLVSVVSPGEVYERER